jgi:hypothetical protein
MNVERNKRTELMYEERNKRMEISHAVDRNKWKDPKNACGK